MSDIQINNSPHPGSFIKSEIIGPLGLSVTEAARALGVVRETLSYLLNERSTLSAEMALRIEKAFGISMEMLMRMQGSYDIAQARSRAHEIEVERYVPPAPQPKQATLL